MSERLASEKVIISAPTSFTSSVLRHREILQAIDNKRSQ